MTFQGALAEAQRKRDQVVSGFEDIIQVTSDLHLALEAVGRDYASLRRTLVGAGRADLASKLKAMKKADTDRLNYALGRQWQG